VRLEVGDVQELLKALWSAVKRADVAEARLPERSLQAAEDRLDDLLGLEGLPPLVAAVNEHRPAGERRREPAPPRQLELTGVPNRGPVGVPSKWEPW
jgi:hypothetical protein